MQIRTVTCLVPAVAWVVRIEVLLLAHGVVDALFGVVDYSFYPNFSALVAHSLGAVLREAFPFGLGVVHSGVERAIFA